MKSIKRNYLKWFNYLLAGVLTILGFTGCTKESADAYGVPVIEYELKGKVINAEQKLLPDMQIVVGEILNDKAPMQYPDTLYTDSKGEFLYKDPDAGNFKLRAKFTSFNKDGEITIYKADSVNIDMGKPQGGSGWYRGKASQEITITVEEKGPEDVE